MMGYKSSLISYLGSARRIDVRLYKKYFLLAHDVFDPFSGRKKLPKSFPA